MANYNTNNWGLGTSKDYVPLLRDRSDLFAEPISLLGHTVTSFTSNNQDPVTRTILRVRNGQIIEVLKTLRVSTRLNFTFTMIFGGDLISAAIISAQRQTNLCRDTIYLRKLCPETPQEEMAFIFYNATWGPIEPTEDFVTDEDTNLLGQQSEVTVEEQLVLFTVGNFVNNTGGSLPALYDVAHIEEDCAGCDNTYNERIVVVGGDGGESDKPYVGFSNDRGVTVTASAAFASAGVDEEIATSVVSNSGRIVVGIADGVTSTATAGRVLLSTDEGATAQASTGITTPVHDVAYFNGKFYAVGGTTVGGVVLHSSTNGKDWTVVTSSALPTSAEVGLSLGVDEENTIMYIGTSAGKVFRARPSGKTVAISNITAAVNTAVTFTSVNDILSTKGGVVEIVGEIASNAAGYAYTINDGAEWKSGVTPASGPINAISGHYERTFIGSGINVYDKDVLTSHSYAVVRPEDGVVVTGDVTGLSSPENETYNYAVGVTSAGMILSLQPYHQWA